MKTIWKFPLAAVSPYSVRMPKGAEVLTVQRQDKMACIWAMVDPDADTENRYFEIYGTGNPIHEDTALSRRYIGTFQVSPFVWHVFEQLQ